MRAATIAALFGEGILVTLNATKLIMYWGGYEYYNSISYHESVHKHEEISKYFLCIFRNEIPLFANIKLNLCSYITTSYSIQRKTPILYL